MWPIAIASAAKSHFASVASCQLWLLLYVRKKNCWIIMIICFIFMILLKCFLHLVFILLEFFVVVIFYCKLNALEWCYCIYIGVINCCLKCFKYVSTYYYKIIHSKKWKSLSATPDSLWILEINVLMKFWILCSKSFRCIVAKCYGIFSYKMLSLFNVQCSHYVSVLCFVLILPRFLLSLLLLLLLLSLLIDVSQSHSIHLVYKLFYTII